MDTVVVQNMANSAEPLSLFGLFWQADFIVKTVIMLLVAASVWWWAIIFEKIVLLRRVQAGITQFEEKFWSGIPLDRLYADLRDKQGNPIVSIFSAAMAEWQNSLALTDGKEDFALSSYERIQRIMKNALDREVGALETRITFLASTGSVAPFIGLFGTVWGIMNSFHSIGMSGNTSLAVVAPGIAEALFATALGLVAAIPAVLAFNKFSRDIDKISFRLESFASEFSTIISRQLEVKSIKVKQSKRQSNE